MGSTVAIIKPTYEGTYKDVPVFSLHSSLIPVSSVKTEHGQDQPETLQLFSSLAPYNKNAIRSFRYEGIKFISFVNALLLQRCPEKLCDGNHLADTQCIGYASRSTNKRWVLYGEIAIPNISELENIKIQFQSSSLAQLFLHSEIIGETTYSANFSHLDLVKCLNELMQQEAASTTWTMVGYYKPSVQGEYYSFHVM